VDIWVNGRSAYLGLLCLIRIFRQLCSGGWLQHLEHACAHIPAAHGVYADKQPNPVPLECRNYLLTAQNRPENDELRTSLLVNLLSRTIRKGIPGCILWGPFLKPVVERCRAGTACAGAQGRSVDRLQRVVTRRAISKYLTVLATQSSMLGKRVAAVQFALLACLHDRRRLTDLAIYRTLARSFMSKSAYGQIKRLIGSGQ
jgi:hypothetical protein